MKMNKIITVLSILCMAVILSSGIAMACGGNCPLHQTGEAKAEGTCPYLQNGETCPCHQTGSNLEGTCPYHQNGETCPLHQTTETKTESTSTTNLAVAGFGIGGIGVAGTAFFKRRHKK
jgi:hypothetical protein